MLWTADSGKLSQDALGAIKGQAEGQLVASEDGTAVFTVIPIEGGNADAIGEQVEDLRDAAARRRAGRASRSGDRTGRHPRRPRQGLRRRRPAAAARDDAHRRRAAGGDLPQPGALDHPPGRRRRRRPGRGGRRDADARCGRPALGRHHDRHPLGARLRRRHRLRPAADLPLPRRAAHDRVAARGDGARAAAYVGGGARQRPHGLPRRARRSLLSLAPSTRGLGPRVRGRHRGRGDVRTGRAAGGPGALRALGLLAEGAARTATRPPSTPTRSSTGSAGWSPAGPGPSSPARWCCSPSWPAAWPASASVSTRPTSSSTGPRRSPRANGWPSPSPPAPSSRPRWSPRAAGDRCCRSSRGARASSSARVSASGDGVTQVDVVLTAEPGSAEARDTIDGHARRGRPTCRHLRGRHRGGGARRP